MKKLAVFVEGQTEQIFIEKLISEIAGAHKVSFDVQKRTLNKMVQLKSTESPDNKEYFVLIYNCECDEQVKSKILDSRSQLEKAGYTLIIGLRDLYPQPLASLNKFKQGLAYGVPTIGVPIRMHLAVAEVEAWFLQERNHFNGVSDSIDVINLKGNFGFDPDADSAEAIEQPADLLHVIYKSGGRAYRKSKKHVERTVEALDYENLCITARPLLPHFDALFRDLEVFVS